MTGWSIDRSDERLYVAGVGIGTCRGRTVDGFFLVDFAQFDCIVAVLPHAVFELREADHRQVCQFSIDRGTA